jgi:arylsulfatase A-like enzyme
LRGTSLDWDNTVFYEFENVRAVRTDRWKYIERFRQEPNELYDLSQDPGEGHNLYGQREYLPAQRELKVRLDRFFTRYRDPRWDLWNGGRSKTGLLMSRLFAGQGQTDGNAPKAPPSASQNP